MKIIRLTAENVKRLRAVEITPDGTLQVITGRNAQGKTSVLDAIWLALGGGQASRETTVPIRDGEDHAQVSLDLGDLRVVRRWTGSGSTLTVTNADGAKYPSPQAVLDALVGRLSFDPLAFTRLSSRDQRQALLDLVDIEQDLTELDTRRQQLYAERTEVGRQGKAYGDVPPLEPDVPEVEVSMQDVVARLREAQQVARRIDDETGRLAKLQTQTEYWQQQLEEAQAGLAKASEAYAAQQKLVKGLPEYPDVSVLEADLGRVEQVNRKVRDNQARRRAAAEVAELHRRYDALTGELAELDHAKSTLLAEAAFPVDGLGFDESGVTYHGVPFSQASSAEQIRVSLSMAMAANPKLRVLRILDGSLLDADSMAQIAELARVNDYQVWVEAVGDADSAKGSAVVIDDGRVLR